MLEEVTTELPPFPTEELPPFPSEALPELQPPKLQSPKLAIQEALKPLEMLIPEAPALDLPKLEKPAFPKPSQLVLEGEELERDAVRKEMKFVKARDHLVVQKPVFVEGLQYRKMLTDITYLRTMLQEGEEHLAHWDHVETSKDTHFEHMRVTIEQVQRKLLYMDKSLFDKTF